MPYDAEKARGLERDDVPLMGVKERLRYKVGPRQAVVLRSRKEDLAFAFGGMFIIGAALWLMLVDTGGLPKWFATIISVILILMAGGCYVFLLWSPHIVLDRLKGIVLIRTWRFPHVNYLAFERAEIEAFEVFEESMSDAKGRPVSEPLYYYIYLATRDGIRVPLMRLYEIAEVQEFIEKFAGHSGVPVLMPGVDLSGGGPQP